MTATVPGLKLSDIGHKLDDYPVFSDLSLTLDGGCWHCILGCSGVGKTTLLRLVAGLDKPHTGNITDDLDQSLSGQVSYMSQDDGLLPWLSVVNNVQLGPRLRGEASAATRQRAVKLLQQVNLSDWVNASTDQLSGGMRQRVALARTLLENKPIVLMDEPFSRLDAITRDELQLLATRLLQGKTVVLVTHDPLEALRLGHTIHVLQRRASTDKSKPDSTHIVKLDRALRTSANELASTTAIAAEHINSQMITGHIDTYSDARQCINDLWSLLQSSHRSRAHEH